MNQEDIKYFQRFGFIQYKGLLSPEEIVIISDAFDEGMRVARKGAPAPKSGEKRQQIIPFFDYDPEVFYPLLDHEKIVDIFEGLMGEDFILTLSEGIFIPVAPGGITMPMPQRAILVCGRRSIWIRSVLRMAV